MSMPPTTALAITTPPRLLDQVRQTALARFGRPEPGERYAGLPVAVSQMRTLLSREAEARCRPSGLKQAAYTVPS